MKTAAVFELRKYKENAKLSEETLCFSAQLWMNGHRIADVSNRGNGGPNEYRFAAKTFEKMFLDHVAQLPAMEPASDAPEWEKKMGPIAVDADIFVGQLCEQVHHAAWLKRQTRGKVLFRIVGDDPGSYRTMKFKPGQREAAVQYAKTKYGADIVELV